MTMATRGLLAGMVIALAGPHAATGQREPRLPEGTYALTFCYPTCGDSASVVGTGTLVYVRGDIRRQMTRGLADSLSGQVNFLLLGPKTRPNACFQARAQRKVAGQEYYVGIIPASLTVVSKLPHDSISVGLYASPDAFFDALLFADSLGVLSGVGRQRNWDGSEGPGTPIVGRRLGSADPSACVPVQSGG
jgi:hypothetical protein